MDGGLQRGPRAARSGRLDFEPEFQIAAVPETLESSWCCWESAVYFPGDAGLIDNLAVAPCPEGLLQRDAYLSFLGEGSKQAIRFLKVINAEYDAVKSSRRLVSAWQHIDSVEGSVA